MASEANSSSATGSKKQKTGPPKFGFSSATEYLIDQIVNPDCYQSISNRINPIENLLDLQMEKKIPPQLLELACELVKHSVLMTGTTNLSEADCKQWILAIFSAVKSYLTDTYPQLKPFDLYARQSWPVPSFEAKVAEKPGEQKVTRLMNGKVDAALVYFAKPPCPVLLPVEVKASNAMDGAIQSILDLTALGEQEPIKEQVCFCRGEHWIVIKRPNYFY